MVSVAITQLYHKKQMNRWEIRGRDNMKTESMIKF